MWDSSLGVFINNKIILITLYSVIFLGPGFLPSVSQGDEPSEEKRYCEAKGNNYWYCYHTGIKVKVVKGGGYYWYYYNDVYPYLLIKGSGGSTFIGCANNSGKDFCSKSAPAIQMCHQVALQSQLTGIPMTISSALFAGPQYDGSERTLSSYQDVSKDLNLYLGYSWLNNIYCSLKIPD